MTIASYDYMGLLINIHAINHSSIPKILFEFSLVYFNYYFIFAGIFKRQLIASSKSIFSTSFTVP